MLLIKLQKKLLRFYKQYKTSKWLQSFLLFLSFFYLMGYRLRLFLYRINFLRTYSLPVFVISIGNLSLGGTGKTQVAIELSKFLHKNGIKVGILSRGYKRKGSNIPVHENILVSDGEEILTDWDVSGDEPYLIAKDSPKSIVLSGSNRVKAAQSAIKLGAQVVILDDGYQYLKLKRDINILMIDSTKELENEKLFPSGELRELPDSLNRANTIILTNSYDSQNTDNYLSKLKKYISHDFNLISMKYKVKEIKGINLVKKLTIENARKLKFIAFSGIGNPESFTQTLKSDCLQIAEHVVFHDHNEYSSDDISQLIQLALKNGIEDIITTEKDAIKISGFCESAPVTFWTCIISPEWSVQEPFQSILDMEKIKALDS